MNGFRKLQERLKEEGWYVGWNHYCCQTCAWDDVPYEHEDGPFKGEQVDLDKVLFNHSQDCEFDYCQEEYECPDCNGEGYLEDDICEACGERGYVVPPEDMDGLLTEEYSSFICYPPEMQDESLFCFSGDKDGVKNLKDILPIIEECGCKYYWDGTGKTRISISW